MEKKKSKKIEFKLEDDLFWQYKHVCEKTGQTMSKRLRAFITEEVATFNENFVKEIMKNRQAELSNIENDMKEYLYSVIWEERTPDLMKVIKENLDKILSDYTNKGVIYNYYNKCDTENNQSNDFLVIDTYVEMNKGEGIVVNNITVMPSNMIIEKGFKGF